MITFDFKNLQQSFINSDHSYFCNADRAFAKEWNFTKPFKAKMVKLARHFLNSNPKYKKRFGVGDYALFTTLDRNLSFRDINDWHREIRLLFLEWLNK